jgi:hypothetical protein
VALVRRFNRTVTERIGALEESFLGRERPLGASRLLWEVGEDGPTKRGIPSALSKEEAPLVAENKERLEAREERARCQIAHVPGKPSSSSCSEPAKEMVDGLVLCERHALEVKLEGQISCWGEMLFHIDIWSREARRRERPDVVRLLEDQRTRATSARHRAYENLDALRRSEMPRERRELEPPTTRGSLLVLPPKAAPRLSPGLRRLRRR